jgi:hypothetical protein
MGANAQAASTTYNNEAAFVGLPVESFEGFPLGATGRPFSVGPFTLTEIDPNEIPLDSRETPLIEDANEPNNSHPTDGTQYLLYDAEGPQTTIEIIFSSPIRHFGVNIVDWGDGDVEGTLSLVIGSDTFLVADSTLDPNSFPSGNTQFFGVISDTPFDTLELITTTSGGGSPGTDSVILDEIYFTPEPSTGFLLLGGLLGIALSGRSRGRALAVACREHRSNGS